MSIRVVCENGHELKVKDKYAGKVGICPHCEVRVSVPEQSPISDTSILAILGSPDPAASDSKTLRGGPLRSPTNRNCPRCQTPVSKAYRACPKCALYLPLNLGRQAT